MLNLTRRLRVQGAYSLFPSGRGEALIAYNQRYTRVPKTIKRQMNRSNSPGNMLLETMFREPSQNASSPVCFAYLSSTDVAPVALIVLGFGIDRCILSNCQLGRSHAVGLG